MGTDDSNVGISNWRTSLASKRLMVLIILLAVLVGVIVAVLRSWLTDDAFISFRYARNLIEGIGLVYNPGERVEGMTNLLWTLWCGLGLGLHVPAEIWSRVWGIAFYGTTIGLLGINCLRNRNRHPGLSLSLPIAALAAAAHTDLSIYATGGLETAAFIAMSLGGYLLLTDGRPIASGVCLALATLTRPDGIIFALLGGLYLLWTGRPRIKSAGLYAAAFALIVVPVQVWRVWYYGDFFPNTYYAKSAYLSWWIQGWHYTRLYFFKYWVLLPGLAAIWLVFSRKRALRGPIALAAAFAIGYTLYVTRVGGDFMFARLLLPAAPFFLILLEFTFAELFHSRPLIGAGVAMAAVVAMLVTPCPVTHLVHPHGITNEWMYRQSTVSGARGEMRRDIYQDHQAEVLGHYLRDLPVRVAFLGDEARVMYKARIHVAVESTTGLTDRTIARRELNYRGWVGHEKFATESYLVDTRKVHFVFGRRAVKYLHLGRISLVAPIFFGEVKGHILHWDPEIMKELERRGARFPHPRVYIDNYISALETASDQDVAKEYAKIKKFYFDQVDDLVRELVFRRRLGIED